MSPANQSTATDGGSSLTSAPESAALHAYVEGGELYIMDGGAYWRFDRDRAWSEWFWCASSPIAPTQERARQIRAAMDEAYPERRIAA